MNRSTNFSLFSVLFLSIFFLACDSEPQENSPPTAYDSKAYVGATVIDGTGTDAQKDMTIIVKDGIIVMIGKRDEIELTENVEVIDVSGKWVIPGLIDMHAHATVLPIDSNFVVIEKYDREASFEALRTMLAFGITTLRNPAAPTADAIEMKNLVENDSILGPTILTTGFALNRTKAFFGPFAATATEEQIREEVRSQIRDGVDFIKVYASLKPEQIRIAIDEAHKNDKKVIGHLQNTSWTEASNLGIDFITHAAPWHHAYLPKEMQTDYRPTFFGRLFWLENVNYEDEPIQEMIASMVKNNISVDPTLITFHTKFWGDDDQYIATENLKLAPELVTSIWNKTTFTNGWTEEDYANAKQQWKKLTDLTKLMYDKGILITAGSDFPNPWVVPGLSLHQEMKLMVDAGIPPVEVIKIATLNGAIALGLDRHTGSIEVGKEADLVFLNSNPLEDIENSRDLLFILNDGERFFPADLNKQMAAFLNAE